MKRGGIEMGGDGEGWNRDEWGWRGLVGSVIHSNLIRGVKVVRVVEDEEGLG